MRYVDVTVGQPKASTSIVNQLERVTHTAYTCSTGRHVACTATQWPMIPLGGRAGGGGGGAVGRPGPARAGGGGGR